MASFSKGTSFTDGVTGDVTAAKLHALVDAATPVPGLITDRTAETSVASDDLVLIHDASETALNKMTVANLMKAELTGTINSTAGTIGAATLGTTTGTTATFTSLTAGTTTSTAATITTGTIPTLVATTLLTTGTGTASAPAIVPTGDTNTGLFFPAADTIAFSEGGAEAMRIDSSGNVGIGLTSPSVKFEVSGQAKTREFLVNNSSGTLTGYMGGYYGWVGSGSNTDLAIGAYGSNMTFFTGGSSTERLRIDSSGRVGIGGSPNTGYNSNFKLQVGDDTSAVSGVMVRGTEGYLSFDVGLNAYGKGRIYYNNTSNYMSLDTNGTERLRIDSSGNVGIGTTSPADRVDVKCGAGSVISRSTGGIGFKSFYDDGRTTYTGLAYDGIYTSGSQDLFIIAGKGASQKCIIQTLDTERLRIDSDGDVSIGTATALSKLHVHGNITLSNTTTATSAGTGGLSKPATYAGYLTVSVNGTSRKIPYYAT